MRIQRPLGHGKIRKRMSCRVLKEIEAAIEDTVKRFDVSRSFVIAVALADVFGIVKQENFRVDPAKEKRGSIKRRKK